MTLKRFLRIFFIVTFWGIFLTTITLFILGKVNTFVKSLVIICCIILIIFLIRHLLNRSYCKNMIGKYELAYKTIKQLHGLRYQCYLGGQWAKINELTKLIEKHCFELLEAGNLLKTYNDMTDKDIEEIEEISKKIKRLRDNIIPPSA